MTGLVVGMVSNSRVVVLSGPLSGRVFLLNSRACSIGSSASCDLMLDEDHLVQPVHVLIHQVGFSMEMQCASPAAVFEVNHRLTSRCSLLNGDHIRLGTTELAFFSGGEADR